MKKCQSLETSGRTFSVSQSVLALPLKSLYFKITKIQREAPAGNCWSRICWQNWFYWTKTHSSLGISSPFQEVIVPPLCQVSIARKRILLPVTAVVSGSLCSYLVYIWALWRNMIDMATTCISWLSDPSSYKSFLCTSTSAHEKLHSNIFLTVQS